MWHSTVDHIQCVILRIKNLPWHHWTLTILPRKDVWVGLSASPINVQTVSCFTRVLMMVYRHWLAQEWAPMMNAECIYRLQCIDGCHSLRYHVSQVMVPSPKLPSPKVPSSMPVQMRATRHKSRCCHQCQMFASYGVDYSMPYLYLHFGRESASHVMISSP